jgi:hypothetical protein
MLGIQKQLPEYQRNPMRFPAGGIVNEEVRYPIDDFADNDSFDMSDSAEEAVTKESIEAERDEKMKDVRSTQKDLNDFADNLEQSDSKVAKKMGKGARFIASAVGLAGTFLVSKYSSKLTIETLKSFGKSKTFAGLAEKLKPLKRPALKAVVKAKNFVSELMTKPYIKETVEKAKNSNIGQKVSEFLKNDKIKQALEPIKNTWNSAKNIKFNGEKIQSAFENTMAATATGSVLVDNLTGRNDNKSVVELATGS